LAELKARDWRTMFVVSPGIVAIHLIVECGEVSKPRLFRHQE